MDDLLDICLALDNRDTVLCGHSLGALAGIKAVLKSPDAFSRLVLIGCSPCYINDPDYYGGFERADLDVMYYRMETDYFAWASGFAPLAMRNESRPELANNFAASLKSLRPDIALSALRMAMQSDLRDVLPTLQLPTLIIQAHNDIAVPRAVGEYLNANIRNSQLKLINAQGHLPHVSAPDQVIEAIREFLNDG